MEKNSVTNKYYLVIKFLMNALASMLLMSLLSMPASAASDIFTQLEGLKIGELLPDTIINSNIKVTQKDGESIYSFKSSLYSNPHIIKTQNDTISYIQMTIPLDKQEYYTKMFIAKPSQEAVSLGKARSELLYAYPEEGIAFIVNGYTKQVIRIQKFSSKTSKDFINNEGKNYQPVPYAPTTKKPTITPVVFIILGVTLLSLMSLLVLRYIIRKKHQTISSNESLSVIQQLRQNLRAGKQLE